MKSIIWNVRSALCPIRQREEGHFMAVLRRKEDGMGFSGKRSLPAYMDLKKEKDVLKRTSG